MTKPLRKTLELPLGEELIPVPITFRVIEIVEQIYNATADIVASVDLATPGRIQRHKVAHVIQRWLDGIDAGGRKRQEILEEVMLAVPERFNIYVGCIQGAVLYSLKYISEEELELLAAGKGLPEEGSAGKP